MDAEFRIETEGFQRKLRLAEIETKKKAKLLIELVAREVVQHAKSLTSETKPGVNPDDGPRRVHPGGWADVKPQLVKTINQRVSSSGLNEKAIIQATAEYAEALDAKTGYDVLGGAEVIARKALKKHTPKIFE